MEDGPRIVVSPAPGELQVYRGALWARTSGGRAVFGWLTMAQSGKNLAQQLDTVLA